MAAAERRADAAFSHGVSERKAREMREAQLKDPLLARIADIYAKRREELPVALMNASVDSLRSHLEYLLQPPPAEVVMPTGPLHPAAVVVISKLKSDPSLYDYQAMVAADRETGVDILGGLLQEHQAAAAAEPRLAQELEKVLLGEGEQQQQQRQEEVPPEAAASSSSCAAASSSSCAAAASPAAPSAEDLTSQRAADLQYAKEHWGLTEENMRDISELETMGFSHTQVLEAYLACERRQEAAANLLLEGGAGAKDVHVAPETEVPIAAADLDPNNVQLSLAQWEAVQRIEELGFDRPTSLEAFIRFHKHEELAANHLLL